MFASLSAALALLSAAQAPSPPLSTSVNLCNATPVTVAFAVTRPAAPGVTTQRGWFNVEPGACLSGAIGTGRGGVAGVHALSGSFYWPGDGGDGDGGTRQCVAAGAMDRPTRTAPCAASEREAVFAPVPIETAGRGYLIEHTVRCRDLSAPDAALCELGERDAQGFAALVRRIEACNGRSAPMRVAVAADGRDGGWRVDGWDSLAPDSCAVVWRGSPSSGTVFVRAEFDGDERDGTMDDIAFCTPAGEGRFSATATPGAQSCPDGWQPLGYRPVMFGPNTEQVTVYD
ncbi:DUF1036 domain-containing protein [Maricaulaceae bacterium MS644]